MGGTNVKVLGEIILQLHPAVAVSHIATPCTNSEHSIEVMKPRNKAACERMNKSPNQQDQKGFHRAIAPFRSMQVSPDEQVRQIYDFINPGKEENQTEAKTFVPENLRPRFLNVHGASKSLRAWVACLHAPLGSNIR